MTLTKSKYMTITEVSHMYGYTRMTVYRHIKTSKMPYIIKKGKMLVRFKDVFSWYHEPPNQCCYIRIKPTWGYCPICGSKK